MLNLVLTLLIGTAGGTLATRMKIPAGAMLGSMLFVAAFNIFTGHAFMPDNTKVVSQIIAGAFIGIGIYKKDIISIMKMIFVAFVMVLGMIFFSLAIGVMFYKVSGLDIVTSLFSCAPGGLMDMTLISQDMGADPAKVVLLQTIRLMTVISLFPTIIKFLSRKFDKAEHHINIENNQDKPAVFSSSQKLHNFILTLLISAVFGMLGYFSKIPAGALIFSMITVGTMNVLIEKGFLYPSVKSFTQILAGALIGERMTAEDFFSLRYIIIPAILMILSFLIMNICLAILVKKVSKVDLTTALFACAPGGATDMTLIASDLGADTPKVAVIQLIRMICIIVFYPFIAQLLSVILT